jgi:pilus assembly protein Flp/PilA
MQVAATAAPLEAGLVSIVRHFELLRSKTLAHQNACAPSSTASCDEAPYRQNGWGMTKTLKRFLADDSGATAIEYGLIAAGISVAIIAALGNVKDGLIEIFTKVKAALV